MERIGWQPLCHDAQGGRNIREQEWACTAGQPEKQGLPKRHNILQQPQGCGTSQALLETLAQGFYFCFCFCFLSSQNLTDSRKSRENKSPSIRLTTVLQLFHKKNLENNKDISVLTLCQERNRTLTSFVFYRDYARFCSYLLPGICIWFSHWEFSLVYSDWNERNGKIKDTLHSHCLQAGTQLKTKSENFVDMLGCQGLGSATGSLYLEHATQCLRPPFLWTRHYLNIITQSSEWQRPSQPFAWTKACTWVSHGDDTNLNCPLTAYIPAGLPQCGHISLQITILCLPSPGAVLLFTNCTFLWKFSYTLLLDWSFNEI